MKNNHLIDMALQMAITKSKDLNLNLNRHTQLNCSEKMPTENQLKPMNKAFLDKRNKIKK